MAVVPQPFVAGASVLLRFVLTRPYRRPGSNDDDLDKSFKPTKILWLTSVESGVVRVRRRRYQQIHHPSARLVLRLPTHVACRFALVHRHLVKVASSLSQLPLTFPCEESRDKPPAGAERRACRRRYFDRRRADGARRFNGRGCCGPPGRAYVEVCRSTSAAYRYAVRNRADMLDGDVRWTKDGSDPDSLGTMIILHDATLDRITNCKGAVSSWLWTSISARCRTDVGNQKLMRLVDLLNYGNSLGKSFALEIKVGAITNAQARQFWNAIKDSRVQLEATPARLPALNKIKKLDAADATHRISYALVALGTRSWPSVSTIKATGAAVHQIRDPHQCRRRLPASQHQGVLVHREE